MVTGGTTTDVRVGVRGEGPRATALADALATAVPGAVLATAPSGGPADLADVDAVVVAADVDPGERPALLLECLGLGLPVLCEPPVADTPAATEGLLQAEAAAGGRLVQVGLARRHDPRFRELRDRVVDGALGTVRLVRSVHEVADPAAPGALAVELDTLAWLLGDPAVELAVECYDRTLLATVRTAGGVVGDVELRAPSGAAEEGDLRYEVVGDDGSAEVGLGAPHLAEAVRIMLTAWVRSIRSGVPVGAGLADALAAESLAADGAVVAGGPTHGAANPHG